MHITNYPYGDMSALILDAMPSNRTKDKPKTSNMLRKYEVMSLEEKAKIVRYRQLHPHESSYRVADQFSIEFCKKVNARAVQRKCHFYVFSFDWTSMSLGIWQKKESILEQAEKKLTELAKLEESRRQSAAYTNTLIGLVMNQDTSESGVATSTKNAVG